MQFLVKNYPVTRVLVRGTEKVEVTVRNSPERVRVVQSASPLPVVGGGYSDPGDLSLIFENKLI